MRVLSILQIIESLFDDTVSKATSSKTHGTYVRVRSHTKLVSCTPLGLFTGVRTNGFKCVRSEETGSDMH